jgi:pSer/pThr/pTyr-binding forkhead associated (FHA) protein
VGATTESADVVLNVDTVSTSHAVFDEDEDGNLFVTDRHRYASHAHSRITPESNCTPI